MAKEQRFILGKGEILMDRIPPPKSNPTKAPVYTLRESARRLDPQLLTVREEVDHIPPIACPHNEAVFQMTVHPSYLAKSYFPGRLLRAFSLGTVGSKATRYRENDKSLEVVTSEFFVAGTKPKIDQLHTFVKSMEKYDSTDQLSSELRPLAEELLRIERFSIGLPKEKIKPIVSKNPEIVFEVVLHNPPGQESNPSYVLSSFQKFLASKGYNLDESQVISVSGLTFLSIKCGRSFIDEVAQFSYLRLIRAMPKLRSFSSTDSERSISCTLPQGGAVSSDFTVAIIDGGIMDKSALAPWVKCYNFTDLGAEINDGVKHGSEVTSAFLFGPLKPGSPISRPYANVHHYRVVDEFFDQSEHLIPVLQRIQTVLQQPYQFINLSLGPDLPIEDDDVHVWTATIDSLLSNGDKLLTVAVGNSGEEDSAAMLDRIQPPSDGVNVLAIGSCDSLDETGWGRAPYSSRGWGRSPGIVKPDAVSFGGVKGNRFYVVNPADSTKLSGIGGTSYAAPSALRTAAGVRATLGAKLTPLAIKTLLLHRCKDSGSAPCQECGWGRISDDVNLQISCNPNEVVLVYQGILRPGQYMRAQLPVPHGQIAGMVDITVTLCTACEVNSNHSIHYTTSGLEIAFRPHSLRFTVTKGKRSTSPTTRTMFKKRGSSNTESSLRKDAGKWETVMKATDRIKGSGLHEPVLDIHYIAREDGAAASNARPIPYAMVVSLKSDDDITIYDKVQLRYQNQLEVLQPVIRIPITT